MRQDSLDPAIKKAYEISYAIFRVAAVLPSRAFAEILEKEALSLLHSAVGGVLDQAQKNLEILRWLITFAKDTNNMYQENADMLIQQSESLSSLIQNRFSNNISPLDLSQIFSSEEPYPGEADAMNKSNRDSAKENKSALPGDRQKIILDKIRQSGNCRAKEIQEVLPNLSERTLRYDLQRLIEAGRIERNGGGGPASCYSIKEADR